MVTVLEFLGVYAGILLYIWRWQFTHPNAWIPMVAALVASHVAHRDSLSELGLARKELASSARVVLPLFILLAVPVTLYGILRHALTLEWPGKKDVAYFLGYFVWCMFQQYLAQGFFHHRLRGVVSSRHLSSALVALMFGGAHIPNPVLMVVTTLGGFALSEVYARHPNLWPLALAHAVGGSLTAALAPSPWVHNMRVGPGYFFFRIS